MIRSESFDLDSRAAVDDPHAYVRGYRERSPLLWSDRHRAWAFLGYELTAAAFQEPRLSSERIPAFQRIADTRGNDFRIVVDLLRGWMVFRDAPEHTRLRDPLRRVFTPRVVERLEPAIVAMSDDLLEALPVGETCDLREAYARPLPALVIAELLGVPGSDRRQFQSWSDELSGVVFQMEAAAVDDARAIAAARHFREYFEDLIAHYTARPGDNLISRLIESSRGGDGLAAEDLVGACTLLLFAGHETTAGLIANGLTLLLGEPAHCARLRADPSLDATAVEELMRLEGPAKTMVRRVREGFECAGQSLTAGDRVFLCISAANGDPAVFANPEAVDLARRPNPHLGFGWGLHHCLGAHLARIETRVALRRLLDRFPDLAAAEAPAWGGGAMGRVVASVRVDLGDPSTA